MFIFGGVSPDGTELNDAYAFRIHGKYTQPLDFIYSTPLLDTYCNTKPGACGVLYIERRWYLFQNVGPVASARSGHAMCTIRDRIFVLGGESEQTKQEDSALIYYLETCMWNGR
jgi:hypothetical protein